MLDTQKAQSPTPMPQFVFYCSAKTLIKTNFWRKGFGLHVPGHNLSVRKLRAGCQGRDLESRPEADAREKCCLSIFLTMDRSICFSIPHRATWAGNGTSHSGLDPLTSVIIQENAPQSCLQENLMEAFSNWGCPTQVTLASVKSTSNQPAQHRTVKKNFWKSRRKEEHWHLISVSAK